MRKPLQTAPEAAAPSAFTMTEVIPEPEARIDVSAQLISLEPGLYTIVVVAPREVRTEGGMVLPCIRVDALPRAPGHRTYIATLSETPLLIPSAPPTYMRVEGERTSVLLTTYKASGPMPPPEIHINVVTPGASYLAKQESAPVATEPSADLTVLVHVQGQGDLTVFGGAWATSAGDEAAIEGFAITLGSDMPRGAIEYQGILGVQWLSPWAEESEFCGSRQLALPLLGAVIRLRGQAAADYICRVWGRFNGAEYGPFEDGTPCQANGEPLTGLRIALVPRPTSKTVKVLEPVPTPPAPPPPEEPKPKQRLRRKWL